MKKFYIAKARRLRGTPFSSRIENQGLTAYTTYNHMLLPAAFEGTEKEYFHLKEHVQVWDVAAERQVQEGLAVDLRACNDYKNGLKAAANVNCPTLCILGDKDKMVPLDKGKKMAESIKNSQLEVIKECGHMIIFEKAFEMREIVKNFVEKNHK